MIRRVLAHVRIFKSLAEHLRSKWSRSRLYVCEWPLSITWWPLSLSHCFLNFRCIALHHLVGFVCFISRIFRFLPRMSCLSRVCFTNFDTLRFLINIRFSMYNAQMRLKVRWKLAFISAFIGICIVCMHTTERTRSRGALCYTHGLKWTRTTDLTLIRRAL